jgi:hypothetical protein
VTWSPSISSGSSSITNSPSEYHTSDLPSVSEHISATDPARSLTTDTHDPPRCPFRIGLSVETIRKLQPSTSSSHAVDPKLCISSCRVRSLTGCPSDITAAPRAVAALT